MATFTFFDSYTTETAAGTHAGSLNADTDVIKAYLTNTTPSTGTHTVKTDLTEITAANGYAGPIDVNNAATITAGTISVNGTIAPITASGGAIAEFQWIVFYNDTPTSPNDPLIGFLTNPSKVNLADTQSFTITFSTDMFKVGA